MLSALSDGIASARAPAGQRRTGLRAIRRWSPMAAWTRAFRLKAWAKLNLTLYVGAVRPNGLHEVRSFAGSLTLCDDVSFEPHDGEFSVICEGSDIPERDNLAFRAGAALGVQARGVR